MKAVLERVGVRAAHGEQQKRQQNAFVSQDGGAPHELLPQCSKGIAGSNALDSQSL
jgi:hypothetical protein